MSKQGTQVWGSAPLQAQPIVIDKTNNRLSFKVDEVECEITIPEGKYETKKEYFTSNLIAPLNGALESAGVPVVAKLGGIHMDKHMNVLVLEHHDSSAPHTIDSFGGSAKELVWGNTEHTTDQYGSE
ncbi:hypothetical protein M3650_24635 [Paenibacillus sp. MER TA 81-3]|uniref:hypothetical protein n=1 Tax=Paenibacillus sp. MER TA 81-3 TaxID=2939573 RepID=UPI00203B0E2C|nr:hypothetical protein [Paenibacillus sp. MER TA 81-3]MCM3341724.1 hypothetical protein [Paenibacillus sp. MER TA 81-3]